ncbi:MAG: DnaD domain protein [Dehalococcoidia bacterium]|nr:DnaD domain protein [Dehalococcoidia bacterium]
MSVPFEGFRTGGRASTLPAQFFTDVLPEIEDADELRVTLYALYAITRPGRALLAMRASEMAHEEPLARRFATRGGAAMVRRHLEAAAARGVLLALSLDDGDLLCFAHNDGGLRLRDRVAAGAVDVPGLGASAARALAVEPVSRQSRPAAVYEQEIGMIGGVVGEQIAEAEQRFPADWIVDAIREAALQNARSWSYVAAILRRWEAEGRDDEATGRDPRRSPANPYEHLIHRGYE